MAEKEKEPNFFQAWADGYQRGRQRFMASMGKGPAPASEAYSPSSRTKPEVKAQPANRPMAKQMRPVEAAPAGQRAPMQIASAPGQDISPVYEQEAYKGFWDDYYAGKRNQAEGITDSGPKYRDPYAAIASRTDDWLKTRGLSNDKVLAYASNRAPELNSYTAPGEADPTLTADELNTLNANTNWDEWYDKNQSRWVY